MIGKAVKDGKKVFCRILPGGKRIEIKKSKDGGWKDVGPLPDKTEDEKKLAKLNLKLKAAEMRKDEAKIEELKAEIENM